MFLFTAFISCGPKVTGPQSMSISPSSNVYLRNAFDMDPSSYIGRFVADGDNNLDEASGMSMSCSQLQSQDSFILQVVWKVDSTPSKMS